MEPPTMAQTSEAACLLQSGSMFPSRVGLVDGPSAVFFGVKPGGFSLYRDDAPIYHFDLEGRWQRAFVEGVHYLKGLDATVRAIDRGREGAGMVLRRRVIDPAEVDALDESIRKGARDLIEGIDSGSVTFLSPPETVRAIGRDELREYLDRISGWDAAAWSAHRTWYGSIYGPWPLLPPDCPSPIVLQATAGRAFGRADSREPSARTVEDFEGHAAEVAAILGRREDQCRDVFLAGSDVLRQPFEDVVGYLRAIGSRFPEFLDATREESPIHALRDSSRPNVVRAFLDDFRLPVLDLEKWRRLKAEGLGRVTLGVESGDPAIRSTYGKSWENEELRMTLASLKAAGIGVGLLVLVGAGGLPAAETHLISTAELIDSLGLERGDLVALVDHRGLDGPSPEPEPLPDRMYADQLLSLKRLIVDDRSSKGPRVAAYNPGKQWA